ncbi:hypothetical protein H8S95_01765 [Pontibacter sp. KCTC 32443]|uniref:hypothetical protein n=1 Tax=Pontibacter TaxID=323449 RepID=UPI00164DD5FA|nr:MULTISPECIES: hypothetical protein [Pontibacter]MBC5772776.1 hypothetical protein [Pontibacter sp. KCTC 32443]
MAKRKSKSKSGSLQSQTITVIIGSLVIFLLLVLGIKIGLVSWLLNLIFAVILLVAIVVNSILAYRLFNDYERINMSKNEDEIPLSIRKIESTSNNESYSLSTFKYKYEKLEARYDKLEQIKESYKQRVIHLELELSQLREKEKLTIQTEVIHPQSKTPEPKAQEPITPKPALPKNSSLFFDGPYDDRVFSETNAIQEKRFRYVYRIEYAVAEPSVGKLYLEPTTEEYDILRSYSDTVLKPACAFDNAFYTSFNNISQLTPGVVHKQGNDWYVKEKVKIRFN